MSISYVYYRSDAFQLDTGMNTRINYIHNSKVALSARCGATRAGIDVGL